MFQQSSSPLRPFFTDNKPTHVWYADKPPFSGGEPREITIAEFMAEYTKKGFTAFEWTETVWSSAPSLVVPTTPTEVFIMTWLKKPKLDKFFIAYINQEVGFGLFARQTIKQGDFLALYASDFEIKNPDDHKPFYDTLYSIWLDEEKRFNAKNRGGIARFMQHLPTSQTAIAKKISVDSAKKQMLLKKISKNDEWHLNLYNRATIPNNIATVNTLYTMITIDNSDMCLFQAAVQINRGELIGFDYGPFFWDKTIPRLFEENGKYLLAEPQLIHTSFYIRQAAFYERFNKEKYDKLKNERLPMNITTGGKPLSFYYFREELVRRGILDPQWGRLEPTDNNLTVKGIHAVFDQKLKALGIVLRCYQQDYTKEYSPKEQLIPEIMEFVLCSTTQQPLKNFWTYLEKSTLEKSSNYYELVNQIVIHNMRLKDGIVLPDNEDGKRKKIYLDNQINTFLELVCKIEESKNNVWCVIS